MSGARRDGGARLVAVERAEEDEGRRGGKQEQEEETKVENDDAVAREGYTSKKRPYEGR